MIKHGHWTDGLFKYLGQHRVYSTQEDNMTASGLKELDAATARVRAQGKNMEVVRTAFLGDPDLTLFKEKSRFCVHSRTEDQVICMDASSMPFTHPEYRGRGLASEIYKIHDEEGHQRLTGGYTVAGLMNRVRTHRLHVQSALERGEELPEAVLADYVVEAGKARLRTPFDVIAYDQRAHDAHVAEVRAAHARTQAHYTVPFTQLRMKASGEQEAEPLFVYNGRGRDAQLALAIKLRHGGQFRTIQIDARTLHQVQIGEQVVDGFGIRPVDAADIDLKERFPLFGGPFTPRVFDGVAEWRASFKPQPDGDINDRCASVEEIMKRVDAGLEMLKMRAPVADSQAEEPSP